MINEFFLVLFQLFLLIVIFSLNPFKILIGKKISNISAIQSINFNILIVFNLILLISFFNQTLDNIFYGVIVYFIILFSVNIFYIKKNNPFFDPKLIVFFLLCFVIFLDVSTNLALSWDGEKFWFQKVLNFYHNFSIENLTNVANPWYPYLGSLIWSFFWKFSLIEYNYSGRLFYAFFYVASLILLIDLIKIKRTYKFLFLLAMIFITYDYYLILSGNQEILIFSLITLCMYCFHKLKQKDPNKYFFLITIFLIINSLIWIKQEGVVFSFIIILTLLFFFNFSFKIKLLITLSFILLFCLRLFIYKIYNFELIINNCCHIDFSLNTLLENISLDRTLLILKFFFLGLFKNYLLPFGIITLLFSLSDKKFAKKNLFIYFFAFLSFSFVFVTYLTTNYDLLFMLKTGLDRLIYQFSPFIIYLFIEYLNYLKIKKNYK